MRRKKRVLLVARDRIELPLSGPTARKFEALDRELEVRVVATAAKPDPPEDPRFRLARPLPALDGPAFYLALPARVAAELRRFRPDAVVVQGTHETAAVLLSRRLSGVDAPVILDLHGDPRAATRLYGSRLRRLLDPLSDVLSYLALRRADGIRTISDFTSNLVREQGREPAAVFPAFVDVEAFSRRPTKPLPPRPSALFVGVLERYKNVDGLVEAWRAAAPRVPGVQLRLVGTGHEAGLVEELEADLPGQVSWTPSIGNAAVAAALDEAWVLVLPSRSEGLPRVVIEAFCRGRAVIGSREGGIPDLVDDGVNGLLVDAEEPDALADTLVRVLSDRALAERLGAGAAASAQRWVATPDEFARRMRDLVEQVAA